MSEQTTSDRHHYKHSRDIESVNSEIVTVKDLIEALMKFPDSMEIGLSATKNDESISKLEISSWQPNVLNIIGKNEWGNKTK